MMQICLARTVAEHFREAPLVVVEPPRLCSSVVGSRAREQGNSTYFHSQT